MHRSQVPIRDRLPCDGQLPVQLPSWYECLHNGFWPGTQLTTNIQENYVKMDIRIEIITHLLGHPPRQLRNPSIIWSGMDTGTRHVTAVSWPSQQGGKKALRSIIFGFLDPPLAWRGSSGEGSWWFPGGVLATCWTFSVSSLQPLPSARPMHNTTWDSSQRRMRETWIRGV